MDGGVGNYDILFCNLPYAVLYLNQGISRHQLSIRPKILCRFDLHLINYPGFTDAELDILSKIDPVTK